MEELNVGVRAWGTHSCPFVWRFLWYTERLIMSQIGTHIPECSEWNYSNVVAFSSLIDIWLIRKFTTFHSQFPHVWGSWCNPIVTPLYKLTYSQVWNQTGTGRPVLCIEGPTYTAPDIRQWASDGGEVNSGERACVMLRYTFTEVCKHLFSARVTCVREGFKVMV